MRARFRHGTPGTSAVPIAFSRLALAAAVGLLAVLALGGKLAHDTNRPPSGEPPPANALLAPGLLDPVCGDRVCDDAERASGSCPADCPITPIFPVEDVCGNGVCEPSSGENASNCPDCVTPSPSPAPPFCGDHVCDPSRDETLTSCPEDCAPITPIFPVDTCDNGICEPLTDELTVCPADCKCVNNGTCTSGEGLECPDCRSAMDAAPPAGGIAASGASNWLGLLRSPWGIGLLVALGLAVALGVQVINSRGITTRQRVYRLAVGGAILFVDAAFILLLTSVSSPSDLDVKLPPAQPVLVEEEEPLPPYDCRCEGTTLICTSFLRCKLPTPSSTPIGTPPPTPGTPSAVIVDGETGWPPTCRCEAGNLVCPSAVPWCAAITRIAPTPGVATTPPPGFDEPVPPPDQGIPPEQQPSGEEAPPPEEEPQPPPPAPFCGDGIVQPETGEECDPPDGVNCNPLCHVIAH